MASPNLMDAGKMSKTKTKKKVIKAGDKDSLSKVVNRNDDAGIPLNRSKVRTESEKRKALYGKDS